ncbi:hypothetical protein [Pendulispora albinea]|uniref:Uncharacterized protein n=1 Tax=Pendulispora albinea TaxID=2741071 RepID=A0ABZ2MA40_9BACT
MVLGGVGDDEELGQGTILYGPVSALSTIFACVHASFTLLMISLARCSMRVDVLANAEHRFHHVPAARRSCCPNIQEIVSHECNRFASK